MISRITNRMKRYVYAPSFNSKRERPATPLTRLGTRYGGWHVALDALPADGWAMFCGAGEDISFDLAFAKATGMPVVIVDPTPRAIMHWNLIKDSYAKIAGAELPPIYSDEDPGLDRISYHQAAIWKEEGFIKFWEPANPEHVSYSLTNLQETDRYIEVNALTPESIARDAGYSLDRLAILKLDIEGAEGGVIRWFLDNNYRIPQILVEFDELCRPSRRSQSLVENLGQGLISSGYSLVNIDPPNNYTFILK